MKIAFFLEIFFPEINGVITATLDLAHNLKNRGHQILLVVPTNKERGNIKDIDGMEIFEVPSFSTFIYPGVRFSNPWSRSLYKKLRQEGVEIIHITGPWTLAWAGINYAKKVGLPIIQTFHTMLNEDTYLQYLVKRKFLVPIVRVISWWYFGKYIKASDVITAPSSHACRVLKEIFPDKKIHHISNGIDRSQFRGYTAFAELKEKYPFYNEKTFIFVGRLGLEKSIDVLVAGFAAAIREDPGIQLVLVGDGPNRQDVIEMISAFDLGRNVFLLGKIAHPQLLKSGLLHNAQAFVTASVTENQPMTIIEAVCCGLPLIAADVEGMRELSSENSLLFPPGDPEGLGKRVLEIARDKEIQSELSKASFALSERFDGAGVAASFEELYREAVAEKAAESSP